MTDGDAQIDARVRSALTELPVLDDVATREALRAVLQRSSAPRVRPQRWVVPGLVSAAVAVVALLVAQLFGGPDTREPRPSEPGDVLGQWQRQVTGTQEPDIGGKWRLTFADSGALGLDGPQRITAPTDGASYTVAGQRLRSDAFVNSLCPEMAAGEYAWTVSGDTLTLTTVEDPCPIRANLFAGTWRRVP